MKKPKNQKQGKEFKLPDLKDIKAGKDGFKNTSTTFDSEFLKFEKEGDVFQGKYMETLQAGKKGKEKDCALFQETKTNKSFLIGNAQIMRAVETYGNKEYRITFLGKKTSGKTGNTYSNFQIEVR